MRAVYRPEVNDRDIWKILTPQHYIARTDGSFRISAGLGWVITEDDQGAGTILA
jgi:hypothetical protein